jgi:hypothetical protein
VTGLEIVDLDSNNPLSLSPGGGVPLGGSLNYTLEVNFIIKYIDRAKFPIFLSLGTIIF